MARWYGVDRLFLKDLLSVEQCADRTQRYAGLSEAVLATCQPMACSGQLHT